MCGAPHASRFPIFGGSVRWEGCPQYVVEEVMLSLSSFCRHWDYPAGPRTRTIEIEGIPEGPSNNTDVPLPFTELQFEGKPMAKISVSGVYIPPMNFCRHQQFVSSAIERPERFPLVQLVLHPVHLGSRKLLFPSGLRSPAHFLPVWLWRWGSGGFNDHRTNRTCGLFGRWKKVAC